jgi:cystathionine beta-lyase/cystathionine gamma-synthase
LSADEREKQRISDSLIRLSVGIEDVEDLIADLENAFSAISF